MKKITLKERKMRFLKDIKMVDKIEYMGEFESYYIKILGHTISIAEELFTSKYHYKTFEKIINELFLNMRLRK